MLIAKISRFWTIGAFVLACAASLPSPLRAAGEPVTLQSLLGEMDSRHALARWPAPAYRCLQASSHDRRKINPADPGGWHSNNDSGQFIRVEQNHGRKEWVIMESDGPGAVVEIWAPLDSSKDKQIVRFYLDGASEPAIEANFNDLLSGRGFAPPPFAFVAWDDHHPANQARKAPPVTRHVAGDFYLPIPYAKGCKITLDEVPFYYHVDYRAYDPGADVRTFAMGDVAAAKKELERTAASLDSSAPDPSAGADASASGKISPGSALKLDLPAGPTAVWKLSAKIDPADAPQALRSLVLTARFDDETTIWCPLGEFFGVGSRLSPMRDWMRQTDADGNLQSRWVMPYRAGGQLSILNLGDKPAAVTLQVSSAPWTWDDRSMHFHANWHFQKDLPTQPRSDWNYLEAEGRGVYVGDTFTVWNPSRAWYGEGDERIYVDGEKLPSHLGTGTEDYYGYAWGMADFFDSPFISMPLREIQDRNDWRGYTTTSRLRSLDAIPFRHSIRTDMEIWHWADVREDASAATFWYAVPGASCNREPAPKEAAVALRTAPPDPDAKMPGAIECETMTIADRSPGLRIETQRGALLDVGQWSAGRQLFVRAEKVGAFITLSIPAQGDAPRELTLFATKSYDYGILRFTVNGQPAGKEFDGFNLRPIASGPIELGRFAPVDGKLLLKAEVIGANPGAHAPKYYFGLDCVRLGGK